MGTHQGFILWALTVENWIGLAQTLVMFAGVIFALWQLRLTLSQLNVAASAARDAARQTELAAKASQAAALLTVQNAGTDILWKAIDDPALHRLFDDDAPATGFGPDQKVALVRGMLIRQFASVYQLRQMGHISNTVWSAHKADMSEFFQEQGQRHALGRSKEVLRLRISKFH